MSNAKNSDNGTGMDDAFGSPDPVRLGRVHDRVMHAYSVELLIKKTIWWVCVALEVIAIVGSMIFLFRTQSTPLRFLCVVIALIAHEGMIVVVLWSILTSLRMDMLRELKGMELQLAEFRAARDPGRVGKQDGSESDT